MMHDTMTPESIRTLRGRLGLTQAAFAVLLNATVPGMRASNVTVSRWEHGVHPPSLIAAEAMRLLASEGPAVALRRLAAEAPAVA